MDKGRTNYTESGLTDAKNFVEGAKKRKKYCNLSGALI